jgi:hypothetical protein
MEEQTGKQSFLVKTPDFFTFCQPKEIAIGLCISREGLGKGFYQLVD